jgi:transposase InsO family protein
MKYAWIAEHKEMWTVRRMCRVLSVSPSGYYDYLSREQSAHAATDEALRGDIRRIHDESRGVYGSPRIHAALRAEGKQHSRKRVARLMQKEELEGRQKKRFVITTQADEKAAPAPNVLNQEFHASAPNRVWASDITYIRTAEGFLYLAVVLDLFSRRVVGWSMATTITAILTRQALRMAVDDRQPSAELIVHSDRGSQYTDSGFQHDLVRIRATPSMSRRGNVWDNAVLESFFSGLKREVMLGRSFRTIAEAQREVFSYIEKFYNRKRLHSTLGYVSPHQFELKHQLTH